MGILCTLRSSDLVSGGQESTGSSGSGTVKNGHGCATGDFRREGDTFS